MYERIAETYRHNNWTWNVSGEEVFPSSEDIKTLVEACVSKLRKLQDETSQIEIGDPGRLIIRKEGDQIYVFTLVGRI
jgi:hypothetical protein